MRKEVLPRIAFFITHHGFGHAARACSVMEALQQRERAVGFEIYSTLPQWFFRHSAGAHVNYHHEATDIGLEQTSPFHSDLEGTLERLRRFLPFASGRIRDLSSSVREAGCRLVVCDIAAMGIAVAEAAGIPSILIENFTWDWIYDGYRKSLPELQSYAAYLAECYRRATYHIQTEPVCEYRRADLITAPAGRKPRRARNAIRRRLRLPEKAPVVVLTFGGVPNRNDWFAGARQLRDLFFIIPGAGKAVVRQGNTILMPQASSFFHPDLIGAGDAVVGKAGYSTIAEVYYAGVPFGYVTRASYRESQALKRFIDARMSARQIDEAELHDGCWRNHLETLLGLPARKPDHANGADEIADFILSVL